MRGCFVKLKENVHFYVQIAKDLFRANKIGFVTILIISLILPLASVVELKFSEDIIDSINQQNLMNNQAVERAMFHILLVMFSLLLFIIGRWLFSLFNIRFTQKVVMQKNCDLMKKISKIPYEHFESADSNYKIWLSCKAPDQYAQSISYITSLFNIFVYFLVYSIMLVQIHLSLLGVLAIAFLLYFIVQKRNGKKWSRYYDALLAPEERMSAYFESVLSNRVNHSTMQINRQLPFFAQRYEEHSDMERKYRLKMNLLSFFTEFAMSGFFFFMMLVILLVTANSIVKGNRSLGSYTLMTSLMAQLFMLFKSLTGYIFSEKEYMKSIQTYYEIMAMPEIDTENPDTLNGVLSVKDVFYQYPQASNNALRGVSCVFEKGEKIALVGVNGSGKTTFVQILLRLLDENSGMCYNQVGKAVAIMQDFQSYQFTIKENVELGRGGEYMDDEEVWNILKQVDMYDYIKKLPDGIYTHIGQLENGVEFSKGQFQRIALARMLANKEARIWILDEPTAFLDPISEIKMYEYILSLAEDRLVFFISHRLGFAKHADRIIVFDNGNICEVGTHDELMHLENGKYMRMYESQLEWYVG